MKRLTKEIELAFDSTYAPKGGAIEMGEEVGMTKMLVYDGICKKLGKYEDFEEKIQVDFETLETACKNGFYSLYFKKLVHPLRLIIFERDTRPYFEVYDSQFNCIKLIYVDDYGETWFLTKEELK